MGFLDELANIGKVSSAINTGWGSGLNTYYGAEQKDQALKDQALKYQQSLDIFNALSNADYFNNDAEAKAAVARNQAEAARIKSGENATSLDPRIIEYVQNLTGSGVEFGSPEFQSSMRNKAIELGIIPAANMYDANYNKQYTKEASQEGLIQATLARLRTANKEIVDLFQADDGKWYASKEMPDENGEYNEEALIPLEAFGATGATALRALNTEGGLPVSDPAITKDLISIKGAQTKEVTAGNKQANEEEKIALQRQRLMLQYTQMTPAQKAQAAFRAKQEAGLMARQQIRSENDIVKQVYANIAIPDEKKAEEIAKRTAQFRGLLDRLAVTGQLQESGLQDSRGANTGSTSSNVFNIPQESMNELGALAADKPLPQQTQGFAIDPALEGKVLEDAGQPSFQDLAKMLGTGSNFNLFNAPQIQPQFPQVKGSWNNPEQKAYLAKQAAYDQQRQKAIAAILRAKMGR